MPGKMTLGVTDGLHQQTAEHLAYDVWRIRGGSNRVNIKQGTIGVDREHVLVDVNTADDLGSYEVILYVKDYFDRFNENINVTDSRLIIPFGITTLDEKSHLNIRIEPTSFTCTL